MQAFNKIASNSITTTWFCFLKKMQQAAKIALMRIKYFISTEMKIEGENFGAKRPIF